MQVSGEPVRSASRLAHSCPGSRPAYTRFMPLPVAEVQRALADERLDGWLLYDFQGSNPIAARLSGLAAAEQDDDPALVLPDSRHRRAARPGARDRAPQPRRPARRQDDLCAAGIGSTAGLRGLLNGMKRVAMEYSPGNNIPYISRVDAGTVEVGAAISASTSCPRAIWSSGSRRSGPPRRWPSHRAASDALYRIKDRAFALVRERLAAGRSTDRVRRAARDDRLVRRRRAGRRRYAERVGAGERRQPALPSDSRRITAPSVPTRCCCSTSGVSCEARRGVCRHHLGGLYRAGTVPDEYAHAFTAARDGRDAAIALVQSAARAGRELRGFEVDRACRDGASTRPATAPQFIHRTGHSLGERCTATACTWTTTRRTTSAG